MRMYDAPPEVVALYPWEDFIDYTVYCTNIQGSALYDSTLGDKELIEAMYEEELKRISSKRIVRDRDEMEARPPRRGYTREVEALYDLIDNVVAMRAEAGGWSPAHTQRAMTKRPWFPGEIVADRVRNRNRTIRDQKIKESQERNRRRNAG